MKNFFLILFAFILAFPHTSNAQYKRRHMDLVDLNGRFKMGGWTMAPGLTYMYPNRMKFLGGQENPEITPKGRIALYLEAGRYRIFPGGGNVFNYMDYTLAYKRLSGSEKYPDSKSLFKQNYLLGNFNINNIIQVSNKRFFQNSLGINVDYKFSEKIDGGATTTDKLVASLHYKLGYGVKVSDRMFIIPSIETPILNGKKWEKGKSTYGIYSSRYRPFIFQLRYVWLRSGDRNACPKVEGMPGDEEKQRMYQMGQ